MSDWIDVKSAPASNDGWVDVRHPSDANLGPLEFNAAHPYLNALVVNPAAQATKSLLPVLDAANRGAGFDRAKNNYTPGMPNFRSAIENYDLPPEAPVAAKVIGDVAGGATKGALATVMGGGNPVLGFGVLSGTEAYGKGAGPIDTAIAAGTGAASAIPYMAGGKAGATIANRFFPKLPFSSNIGTGAGMATAGAAMNPNDRVRGAATGGAFGVMSPMLGVGQAKPVTHSEYSDILDKHGDTYRQILAPTKGEVKNVEIYNRKDINDYYKLAAQEGLVIDKSADNKIDTSHARVQLQQPMDVLENQLDSAIKSSPAKQFDLNEMARRTKIALNKKINNASELKAALRNVDKYTADEITRHGTAMVSGEELNTVKRGLWNQGYDQLRPTAQSTARALGTTIKNAIEEGYPQDNIKGINAKLGQYATLNSLLENAQGRIVNKGKVGRYAAQIIGAMAGHASHIPFGDIAAGWAGGKLTDILNDPARLTSALAKRLNGFEVSNPAGASTTRPGVATPEIVSRGTSAVPQGGIGFNPIGRMTGIPDYSVGRDMGVTKDPFKPPFLTTEDTPIPMGPPASNPRAQANLGNPAVPTTPPFGPAQPNPRAESQSFAKMDPEMMKKWEAGLRDKGYTDAEIKGIKKDMNKPSTDFKSGGNAKNAGNHGKNVGKLALGFGAAALFGAGHAQAAQNIDMKKIYKIESSGNPAAHNKATNARGLGQITPVVLNEWNSFHPNDAHAPKDLFDKTTNMKVADWYMNQRIPQMLKHYKIQDTTENRLIAYNAGIRHAKQGTIPHETADYIAKYKK